MRHVACRRSSRMKWHPVTSRTSAADVKRLKGRTLHVEGELSLGRHFGATTTGANARRRKTLKACVGDGRF